MLWTNESDHFSAYFVGAPIHFQSEDCQQGNQHRLQSTSKISWSAGSGESWTGNQLGNKNVNSCDISTGKYKLATMVWKSTKIYQDYIMGIRWHTIDVNPEFKAIHANTWEINCWFGFVSALKLLAAAILDHQQLAAKMFLLITNSWLGKKVFADNQPGPTFFTKWWSIMVHPLGQ